MDNSGKNVNDSNTKTITDTAKELAHITEEMYKKNFELAEKNKILSLLRKIDEIIMTAVTDEYQIAQQVVDTVATEASFKAVVIYLIEKDGLLSRVALSQTELTGLLQQLKTQVFQEEIKLSDEKNVIAKSVNEKKLQIVHDIRSEFISLDSSEALSKIDVIDEVKSTLIYPLIVRNEPLGALVLCVTVKEDDMPQYQKDLIYRLVSTIGIAIDNAFLYQEIRDANARLKELDRLKDEFVSLASHELRTPMTAIKSYLWMALDGQGGVLNEKQRHYVQRSYNSVDRLIKLVNDMLNISRIDSGRLTVQVKSCSCEQMVREVVDDVGARATELGITVAVEQRSAVAEVLADPDKIKEVIYNLIGNSMKFTPSGGKITVSCTQQENMVEIEIKDTGTGIAAEDLSKLFQKFGILPGSYVANQSAMGTGLGLYICRSLVGLHGGKIWASSEGKGRGTTFTFSLKVFNQEDFNKFNEKYNQQSQSNVGLVHNKPIS